MLEGGEHNRPQGSMTLIGHMKKPVVRHIVDACPDDFILALCAVLTPGTNFLEYVRYDGALTPSDRRRSPPANCDMPALAKLCSACERTEISPNW